MRQYYEKKQREKRMETELIAIQEDAVIANLSKCVSLIDDCTSAADVKKFVDAGLAAKVWATRQARGIEARNAAEGFALRAERRLGEILLEAEKHPGGRPTEKPVVRKRQVPKLSDIGNIEEPVLPLATLGRGVLGEG
jgi:hypothetical protein